MRFLMVTTTTCIISFILSGVFFSFSNFGDLKKEAMSGKFKWVKNFNMNVEIEEEADWAEKEFRFSDQDLKSVKVKAVASELVIERANVDEVILSVKMLKEDLEEDFKAEVSNGILSILDHKEKKDKKLSSLFGEKGSKGSKIKILVPESLESSFDLDISFGDIKIKGVSGNDFALEVAAGDIELEDINFLKFVLKAAAGEVDLNRVSMGEGKIEAAAGDIELEGVKSKGKLLIEAAAGDIDVEMNQPSPQVEITAAAGDIDFSLSEGVDYNFTFRNSTTVGSLELKDGAVSKDGDHVYGNGEGLVEIETTFGDVEVK
ncbi:MAG: DUF4097 family beta strand repeat-containing protein [Bdellovibrionales bacterium]